MIAYDNIALLSNSFSGKGHSSSIINSILKKLEKLNLTITHFQDQWPHDLSVYTAVWIVGGDGTLNYFLNKYPSCSIPISIFPGGTGNDFHWKVYGKISIDEQIEAILKKRTMYIDIGKCNEEYFINTVGLGFDGEVLKDMKKVRKIGGHLGYLLIVLKNIFTYREKRYFITKDENKAFETEAMLCIISNSSRTGGGFMVSPLAEIIDGLLNLVLSQKISTYQRIRLLLKVEKGNHLLDEKITHFTLQKIKVSCNENFFYQLDGDLRQASSLEIAVIKHTIRMLH